MGVEVGSLYFRFATQHCLRIRKMMEGFGQATPDVPTMPDEKTRILRARLIVEEGFCEFTKAAGITIKVNGQPVAFEDLQFDVTHAPNFVEMVDALVDTSVVTIGSLVAMGVPDDLILRLVDENNLLKIATGRKDEHGKFIKHPDHKPPDVAGLLRDHYGCDPALLEPATA